MKNLFYILLVGLILACNDTDFIEPVKPPRTLDPVRTSTSVETFSNSKKFILKGAKGGYEGGLTSMKGLFKPTGTGSKGGDVDDGLFISQYPLVEFRYIQEVLYDSVYKTQVKVDTLTTYSIIDSTAVWNINIDSIAISETIIDSIPIIENNITTGYTVTSRDTSYFNIQTDTLGVSYEPIMDTIPIHEVFRDTLFAGYIKRELSRDTLGFERGTLWAPFNNKNRTKFYVGLKKSITDTLTVYPRVRMEMLDSIPTEGTGLLFMSLIGDGDTANLNGAWLDPVFTTYVDDIPTYDESGKVNGTFEGMEMYLQYRHFQIGTTVEVTRHFRLSIETPYGTLATQEFKLKFVTMEEYLKRQYWLNQLPGYEDAYTE